MWIAEAGLRKGGSGVWDTVMCRGCWRKEGELLLGDEEDGGGKLV